MGQQVASALGIAEAPELRLETAAANPLSLSGRGSDSESSVTWSGDDPKLRPEPHITQMRKKDVIYMYSPDSHIEFTYRELGGAHLRRTNSGLLLRPGSSGRDELRLVRESGVRAEKAAT